MKLKSDSYVAAVHLAGVFVIATLLAFPLASISATLSLDRTTVLGSLILFILSLGLLWFSTWVSAHFFIRRYFYINNSKKVVSIFMLYNIFLTFIAIAIGIIAGALAIGRFPQPVLLLLPIIRSLIKLAVYYCASIMYIKDNPSLPGMLISKTVAQQ
ncbi:MAG: hypothetical protein A3B30_01885 [Candidatus Komeilibacteria bacterium RIFCSPLOWO2_01_FULL_52_15]|uniref:Uncharacterized protein n=2 Tax=Candidatus Komeiliibacteriota TaxID=1817908 RepID=A0A1G2BRH0_9BACT|nr:MAG: hypothetical protein A2677_02205 [Candidatus Komeilibacteria bacterium RIFCSPHIGHO2_01_FULL_52_14]OGY91765.1 MAG: hypothetical protein A3B30_01885 [Candidatus Komeilibacteria bacterium RIFCSPLOWO2_01_FULL_52_15]